MERRKPRGSTDELAVVKAAAWAWYQHGSGSEGKPMPEFDLARIRRPAIPSRYKLEALRMADYSTEGSTSPAPTVSPSYTDSNSLLDPYEIQRISQQLDYFIETSSVKFFRESSVREQGRRKTMTPLETYASVKKMSKKLNGFWLRHAAVVCGSSGDVVEAGVLGGQRRPLKHVSVVSFPNCRPRATSLAK
ncbi:PREDICTED: uncharacterized protein LOC104607415 [Nelumbo nucifera]|uniref:Uncharacterized protein n=2 Tax=Nelumbo nucifera TaxID=4432 RepID=A0A822YI31_NELNU|nr:PREDICTED: uncharacterized protein LOC104607415 [Nelumbo nucifera]DAD32230.1 TPA_asm: hypothetical protein HUJ06_011081 [Nelumbo nucifera]